MVGWQRKLLEIVLNQQESIDRRLKSNEFLGKIVRVFTIGFINLQCWIIIEKNCSEKTLNWIWSPIINCSFYQNIRKFFALIHYPGWRNMQFIQFSYMVLLSLTYFSYTIIEWFHIIVCSFYGNLVFFKKKIRLFHETHLFNVWSFHGKQAFTVCIPCFTAKLSGMMSIFETWINKQVEFFLSFNKLEKIKNWNKIKCFEDLKWRQPFHFEISRLTKL